MSEEKGLDSPPAESMNSSEKELPSTVDRPADSVNSSEQDLPTVRGKIPNKVWLVQGLYFLERAAFYGLSQPLRESPMDEFVTSV